MAQLINTENTHTNTNTQKVLIDNYISSIPSDVIEVIIEFLEYDELSKFYEYLGQDISKNLIIPFLSRKYKIIDNNKYFSKNKINDQLWLSAWTGHKDIVSMLKEVKGIDVNQTRKKYENTPLWIAIYTAVEKDRQEIVSMLLKVKGIDVNQTRKKYGNTPLYMAADKGHKEIVDMLLKVEGINVNKAKKNDKRTPLYVAAEYGHKNIVSMLLKVEDIDVNKADKYGEIPLYIAAIKGHKDIVSMLLKVKGIYVDPLNKRGWTPLCIARRHLYRPIWTYEETGDGLRPCHGVGYNRHRDIADMLLKSGASNSLANDWGEGERL